MGQKILLIDDEEDFTALAAAMLEFHDFVVDIINDPTEVQDKISQNNYELIVTDLMMPKISGFELVNMIRQKNDLNSIPIIVLSARSLTDEERKDLLQSKVHFMSKPFEPQDLVDRITELAQNMTSDQPSL